MMRMTLYGHLERELNVIEGSGIRRRRTCKALGHAIPSDVNAAALWLGHDVNDAERGLTPIRLTRHQDACMS
eukprot:794685-Amphidinium_carterae.1